MPINPSEPPSIINIIWRTVIWDASSGMVYKAIFASATIITPGGEISPALTPVSPRINAPTTEVARPR